MKKTYFLCLVSFLLSCSSLNDNIAGTASETDTGCTLAGLIQYSDSSAVSDADVVLYDQLVLKRVTLSKRLAQSLVRSGSTKTNINGFFRIDSVDTGHFLVEINDHDTLGAVLPMQILPSDTLIEVTGTLHHLGTIIGRIDTTQLTGLTGTVYLPEIGRRVEIDSLGYFAISNLPVWNYYLRLAVGDSIIALPSDSIRVPVTGKDTTRVSRLGTKSGTVVIDGTVIENPIHP